MKSVLMLLSLICTPALAEEVDTPATELPEKTEANTLGVVDAETNAESTSINVRFEDVISWEAVTMTDHGSFIQIELPETIVPNPGDFIDGIGKYLKKMAVFQITPQTGALRLFVDADALLVKQAMQTDILGDRVLLTINHSALENLISNDPTITAAPAEGASADEIIAETSVEKDVAEPASVLQNTKSQSTKEAEVAIPIQEVKETGFDFQEKLTSITIFCGVLLFGMIAFLFAAPRVRKAKMAMAAAKGEVTMKSLASHSVAPKQKLELIDVAGQQILIGVTPGNINFLTTINPKSEAVAQSHLQPKQYIQAQQPMQKQIKPISAPKPANISSQRKVTSGANAYNKQKPKSNEAINDVTKLIREKLKNIPSV